MADRRAVEVSGLPSRLNDVDFIKDQLLIHFLQHRNGGGCDLIIQYPTDEEGGALLVFEDEKVAEKILSRKHSLVIGDRTHPLEVRRPQAHDSQFSMPVQTSVDLSHFSNVVEVKELLERHKLFIYHESSSILGIKGVFCDLRRCRQDLYKILQRQNPVEKQNVSLEPKLLQSEERGRRAPQNVTTTPDRTSPSSSSLSRRQPEGRGHLAQDSVTRDHKNSPTQHSSPRTSPHESSTRSPRAPTPTRLQKVSAPKSLTQTFPVDAAVHRYVRIFCHEEIDYIRRRCHIDMKEEHSEGFTSITLTSLTPEQPEVFRMACNKIKKIFDSRLREENIKLPTRFNEEMLSTLQRYLLKRKIYSRPMADNSLHVIGPSEEILIFLQEWNGTRGNSAQSIIEGSGAPRPHKVEMESKNLVTHSKSSTPPGASAGRARGREAGPDVQIRGREKPQDGAGSGRGKSSTNSTKQVWK